MTDLLPLEQARAHVLERVSPIAPRKIGLADAVGCVTAEDVTAAEPVPGFDNTAMDGYALRSADVAGASADAPVRLDVRGTIAAGSPDRPVVGDGQAVRIMTGAEIPPGADAVVMVERTRPVGDDGVEVLAAVPVGNHIRRRGDDVEPDDVVAREGVALSGALIGVLASVGVREVWARRPPRVGVMSTGDELAAPSAPLGPGQIRDSNRPMLLAHLAEDGFEPVDLGSVPDDERRLRDDLLAGARSCDAVLTSGGVSVGDFDLVKAVLDDIGEMRWMQIAIRPAKPFAFGVVEGTPVFGLPGNPVSSLVSFELLARPALRRMMGHRRLERPQVDAVADDGFARHPDGKLHLVRVRATYGPDSRYHAVLAGAQGSHQLTSMADANALALLADGDGVEPGGTIPLLLLGESP